MSMTPVQKSRVGIYNRACAIARQGKTIAAHDEESNLARLCRLHYDDARREALGSFDWPFGTRVVSANKVAVDGQNGYKNLFAIPNDNIVILGCYASFEMEKMKKPLKMPEVIVAEDGYQYLASDADSLVIKYVRDNEDYPMWNPAFSEYVAHCLAMRIAESLDLSSSKIAEILQLKTMAGSNAASKLSTEKDNKDVSKDNRYIRARGL